MKYTDADQFLSSAEAIVREINTLKDLRGAHYKERTEHPDEQVWIFGHSLQFRKAEELGSVHSAERTHLRVPLQEGGDFAP